MLKSSISILLSFSILLQGLNFHISDMIELQALMTHLEEHQSSYGDDLLTFFDKHYGDQRTEHDQEEHNGSGKHEKLPFKHNVCHVNSGIMINSFNGVVKNIVPVVAAASQSFFYQENYSFLNLTEIFQPPQFF